MKFNVLNNISKEYLTLQLEDILTPKKIETIDSRIRHFSMLATAAKQNMKVFDEFKIIGFQIFEQYMKINPISIQTIDPDIQTKLLYHSKRIQI